MSDIQTLERDLLAGIDSAKDEAALETIRVSAIGKKGSVSELLCSSPVQPLATAAARDNMTRYGFFIVGSAET